MVKDTGAVEWAGVAVTLLELGNYSLLTAEHTEMLVNVYAPAAGETVKLKLENSADATESVEADLVTTTAGWQTMRFDFTNHTDGTPAFDPSVVYDKIAFFPSLGDAGAGQTYYLDDVRFLDAVPELVIPTVTLTVDWDSRANVYEIDGERGAPIEFEPGTNYVLDITALSGYEDFFQISSTPDGINNGGTPFADSSVVLRDVGNGQILIYPTDDTPTLYYYDTSYADAGGAMYAPVVLTVTASGGKYFIDGVEQGFVDLDPGKVYKFDVSDQSMSSHPLALSTTADGTHGGGNEYSDADYSVAQDGTITLFVDDSTPTLYYYCEAHRNMGGEAALYAPIPPTPTGGVVLDFEDMPLTVMAHTTSRQMPSSVTVTTREPRLVLAMVWRRSRRSTVPLTGRCWWLRRLLTRGGGVVLPWCLSTLVRT